MLHPTPGGVWPRSASFGTDGQPDAWTQVIDGLRSWDALAIREVRRLCVSYLRAIDTHGLGDSLEDICQDAFIALFLHSPEMEDPRAAACYLRKTLRNAYVDHLRREFGRRRLASSSEGTDRSQAWRRYVSLDECANRQHDTRFGQDVGLGDALARLCTSERKALLDKYVLGLSDAEAAGRVPESISTYRRVTSRALANLRKQLR